MSYLRKIKIIFVLFPEKVSTFLFKKISVSTYQTGETHSKFPEFDRKNEKTEW